MYISLRIIGHCYDFIQYKAENDHFYKQSIFLVNWKQPVHESLLGIFVFETCHFQNHKSRHCKKPSSSVLDSADQ